MPTGVGILAIEITSTTATLTAMEQDRTLKLPPAPEKKIAPSAPFVPLIHTQRLIVGNWIKTRARDLITGLRFSNDTRWGQLTVKSRG